MLIGPALFRLVSESLLFQSLPFSFLLLAGASARFSTVSAMLALLVAVVLTLTSGWEFARDVVRHRAGRPTSAERQTQD